MRKKYPVSAFSSTLSSTQYVTIYLLHLGNIYGLPAVKDNER